MAQVIRRIFDNLKTGDYSNFSRVYIWYNEEWKIPLVVNREHVVALTPQLDKESRLTGWTMLHLAGFNDPVYISNSEAEEFAKWLCK